MTMNEKLSVRMEEHIALYSLTDLLTKIDEEGTVHLTGRIKLNRETLELDAILSPTTKYTSHEQSKNFAQY